MSKQDSEPTEMRPGSDFIVDMSYNIKPSLFHASKAVRLHL